MSALVSKSRFWFGLVMSAAIAFTVGCSSPRPVSTPTLSSTTTSPKESPAQGFVDLSTALGGQANPWRIDKANLQKGSLGNLLAADRCGWLTLLPTVQDAFDTQFEPWGYTEWITYTGIYKGLGVAIRTSANVVDSCIQPLTKVIGLRTERRFSHAPVWEATKTNIIRCFKEGVRCLNGAAIPDLGEKISVEGSKPFRQLAEANPPICSPGILSDETDLTKQTLYNCPLDSSNDVLLEALDRRYVFWIAATKSKSWGNYFVVGSDWVMYNPNLDLKLFKRVAEVTGGELVTRP